MSVTRQQKNFQTALVFLGPNLIGFLLFSLIPLVLSGPPTGTGFGDGRPPVREVVAYWPALIPRELIQTSMQVVE